MEAEEFGNTGIKPAEGIWLAQRPEEAKLIAFPEVKRPGAHVATLRRALKPARVRMATCSRHWRRGRDDGQETERTWRHKGGGSAGLGRPLENCGLERAPKGRQSRKHVAEPKASLAQSGKGRPAGKSSELHIGDFCVVCSRQREIAIRGMPPMPVARPSFSSSMAATMEVSSTRTAEESRPKAHMPRANIASVCHDCLSQALRRGF